MGVEGEFMNNRGGWGMTATVGTAKGPEEQYFKASALLSPWGQRCDGCPPNSPFVLKVLGPARGEKKNLKDIYFIDI